MNCLNSILAFLFTFLSVSLYPREFSLQMPREVATNPELFQEVHDERSVTTGVIDEENTFYDIKDMRTVDDMLELVQYARAGFKDIVGGYLNALKADEEMKSTRNFAKFKMQFQGYNELLKQLQNKIIYLTRKNIKELQQFKPEIQQQLQNLINDRTQPPFYALSPWTKVLTSLIAPFLFTSISYWLIIIIAVVIDLSTRSTDNQTSIIASPFIGLTFISPCIGFLIGFMVSIASWRLPSPGDYLNPTSSKEQLDKLGKIIEALGVLEKKLALAVKIKADQLELAKI